MFTGSHSTAAHYNSFSAHLWNHYRDRYFPQSSQLPCFKGLQITLSLLLYYLCIHNAFVMYDVGRLCEVHIIIRHSQAIVHVHSMEMRRDSEWLKFCWSWWKLIIVLSKFPHVQLAVKHKPCLHSTHRVADACNEPMHTRHWAGNNQLHRCRVHRACRVV